MSACAHCGATKVRIDSVAFRVADTGDRSLDWVEIKDACPPCLEEWTAEVDPPSLRTLNDRAASDHYSRGRRGVASGVLTGGAS